MNKKVFISQSDYIPWKGYFDAINYADEFIIYDDMQYTRRDWRNRNKIKTPYGTKWLTIPVLVKGRFHQQINETKIADKGWGRKHWRIIQQFYKKAPYYKEVSEEFAEHFLNNEEDYLTKVNQLFIEKFNEYLGIETRIKRSEEFELSGGKTEKLVNICKQTGATEYCSGPSARDYLDMQLFKEENIQVSFFNFNAYPEYPQLYSGFEHKVSIFDLLFNMGKGAASFMKSFNNAEGMVDVVK